MNGRGTYGAAIGDAIPLRDRDDSGFASSPLAGRGQYGHSFHGHEAATYGSGGYGRTDFGTHWGLSWKPHLSIIGEEDKRGTYGPQRAFVGDRVGLELPGTSYANVDQLNTQIVTFARAVIAAAGADTRLVPNSGAAADIKAMHDSLASYPGGGMNSAIVDSHDKLKAAGKIGTFWYDEVAPFLTEWQDFQQKHTHWYDLTTQLATGSEVYRTWAARLNALRAKARSLNLMLPAEQTPPSESESLFAGVERLLGTAGKVVVISAIAIAGAFAVAELAKKSKS
jgi:hypothetical protein